MNVARAQNYYKVTHTTGTQTIGSIGVTVTAINGAGVYPGNYCGAGPYFIGQGVGSGTTTTAYKFSFTKPIAAANFQITASDTGEAITFWVNDSLYMLSSNNVSNYTGFCGNPNGWYLANGVLAFSARSDNNSQVQIEDSITSVKIAALNYNAGSVFSFSFVMDTTSVIEMSDSIFCVGDTMHINYSVTGTYLPGNQFKFQLSDKNGSFASPLLLGTVNGTTAGMLNAVIPPLPSGEGYRMRIISTAPADTSDLFFHAIRIGNPVIMLPFNTGPGCEGDTLKVGVNEYSHVTERIWNGPGLLPNYLARIATINNVKLSDGGMYHVEVRDNGCVAYDSTYLVVYPNPVQLAINANSPVCEGDTLKLLGSIDSVNATNTWIVQDNTYKSGKDIIINKTQLSDSGRYILVTKLNGCTAKDTAYVTVKPLPYSQASSNTPVCKGDVLELKTKFKFTNATYSWSGPNGFQSSVADTFLNDADMTYTGQYTITTTLNGCVAKETVDVQIKPRPDKPIVNSNGPVCEGADIVLTGSNIDPAAYYEWSGPLNFVNSAHVTQVKRATLSAEGVYVFKGNIGGCIAADSLTVVVKPLPELPQVNSNGPLRIGKNLLLKLNNPQTGATYQWVGPQGFMSNEFNPVIIGATKENSGVYTINATLNGCSRSSLLHVVVDELVDTGYVVLYPNANDGNFTVKALLYSDQQIALKINNAAGQEIYSEITGTQNKLLEKKINLKDRIAAGVYSFRITIDGQVKTIPFVVNRQ